MPSAQYLEPCPIPKRYGDKNKNLRNWSIELVKSLEKCNLDKEAIKQELSN